MTSKYNPEQQARIRKTGDWENIEFWRYTERVTHGKTLNMPKGEPSPPEKPTKPETILSVIAEINAEYGIKLHNQDKLVDSLFERIEPDDS